jgi:hypothetical protein
MTDSSRVSTQAAPADEPFYKRYGCFILPLLFLAAIPIWLFVFPESYQQALEFVFDAFLIVLLLGLLSIFISVSVRKGSRAKVFLYGLALVAAVVAGVSIWNFAALYSSIGWHAIAPFGWDFAASPRNLVLLFVAGFIGMIAIAAGVQKLRGRGKA